jgi:hypothetical protein
VKNFKSLIWAPLLLTYSISDAMREKLLERIKKKNQICNSTGESTDISNLGLRTYLRYCFENRVHEDLLFCQTLEGRTAGENIFF